MAGINSDITVPGNKNNLKATHQPQLSNNIPASARIVYGS